MGLLLMIMIMLHRDTKEAIDMNGIYQLGEDMEAFRLSVYIHMTNIFFILDCCCPIVMQEKL